METVNMIMADPIPYAVLGVFGFWLWNADPDVVMLTALGGLIWWAVV